MTTTRSTLDTALALAARGLAVFPVYEMTPAGCACGGRQGCSPGKHPRTARGHKQATTAADIIRAWWTQWPDANIGAAMDESGLIGIDIDPRHGGDETWNDLRREIGPLPDTWTNLTGGGGVHYLFRVPPGFICRTDSLGEGVDVKYHGYLLLPPSNHESGQRYAWEIGYGPEDETSEAALLPPALAARIASRPSAGDLPPGEERSSMAALLQQVCPEGRRDVTLISLVGWARNTYRSQAEALAVLRMWNEAQCRPPLPDAAVVEKVERAWRVWEAPVWIENDWSVPPAGKETAAPPAETAAHDYKPRYALIDALDFLDRLPPPWLIEGVIAQGAFGCIYGAPGTLKTFFSLHIALCIATGMSFFGRRVAQAAGAVVYVAAEGSSGLAKRIRAWLEHFGIALPRGRLIILPAPVPFTDAAAVRALVTDIRALDVPVSHVFIDTVSRALAGGDENAPEAMGQFVMACGMVQQALQANVTCIHHGTKNDGTLRGHSSLPGALDWIVRMTATGEGDAKVVRVVGEKQKDDEPLDLLELKPVPVDVSRYYAQTETDEDGLDDPLVIRAAVTSLVLEPLSDEERATQAAERKERASGRRAMKLKPVQRKVAEALYRAHGTQWATHDQWWKACRNIGMETTDRQSYRQTRARLVELGYVEIRGLGDDAEYQASVKLAEVMHEKPDADQPKGTS